MYALFFAYVAMAIGILLSVHQSEGCFSGRSFASDAAGEFSDAIKVTSAELGKTVHDSMYHLEASLKVIAASLENVSTSASGSFDTASKEFGSASKQLSADIKHISQTLASSFDRSVDGASVVLQNAIQSTESVAEKLVKVIETASKDANSNVATLIQSSQIIVHDLKQTAKHIASEWGSSIRHIAIAIDSMAKQFNLKLDSGDLIEVTKEVKQGLVQAINDLSHNWQVVLSSAHLEHIGASAAKQLRMALENVQIKLHILVDMKVFIDDNLSLSVIVISVSVVVCVLIISISLAIILHNCKQTCPTNCVVKRIRLQCLNFNGRRERNTQSEESDLSSSPPNEDNNSILEDANIGLDAKGDNKDELKEESKGIVAMGQIEPISEDFLELMPREQMESQDTHGNPTVVDFDGETF